MVEGRVGRREQLRWEEGRDFPSIPSRGPERLAPHKEQAEEPRFVLRAEYCHHLLSLVPFTQILFPGLS